MINLHRCSVADFRALTALNPISAFFFFFAYYNFAYAWIDLTRWNALMIAFEKL
jgi:hypothetical protein